MYTFFSTASFICFYFTLQTVSAKNVFALDERWVCGVKASCAACLRLPQCSWCKTEEKCFSSKLPQFESFCLFDRIDSEDYGFSLEENAKCKCNEDERAKQCYPPGIYSGDQCSGRGNCVCGHCACFSNIDKENPTKKVMGEYCEYDNFSCDDHKCNEGPYHMNQTATYYEYSAAYARAGSAVEAPEEMESILYNKEVIEETTTSTSTDSFNSFLNFFNNN